MICNLDRAHQLNTEKIMEQRESSLVGRMNYFYKMVDCYLQELIRYKLSLNTGSDSKDLSDHYNQLQQLKNSLEKFMRKPLKKHFAKMSRNRITIQPIGNISLSKELYHVTKRTIKDLNMTNVNQTELQYSCKETYTGYPGYNTGFTREVCERPGMNETVSIVLDRPLIYLRSRLIINETIKVASRIFSQVFVLFEKDVCQTGILSKITRKANVHFVCVEDGSSFGIQINIIILTETSSPFVIIAPRVSSFEHPLDVERMVHVYETTDASIIGAATKDIHYGKWDRGCYQTSLRLYKLQYIPGYHQSTHECLKCHFLSGPFLTTVKFFGTYKFRESIMEGMYEDFFLRLKMNNATVLDCPDVMMSTYDYQREQEHFQWFAELWDVFFFRHFTQNIYSFDCASYSHKQLTRKCRVAKGIAIPPCCLALLQNGLNFLVTLCQKYQLKCELQDGSVLGAVKFHAFLPWEQDADVSILSDEFGVLQSLKSEFTKKGYQLIIDHQPKCCTENKSLYGGVAHVRVHHWSIQLYGRTNNRIHYASTMLKLGNVWVNGPENPGLYARNRYGYEIYKHAEHWMTTGKSDGWTNYEAGRFESCPRSPHHSCLDNYVADGDLQFLEN